VASNTRRHGSRIAVASGGTIFRRVDPNMTIPLHLAGRVDNDPSAWQAFRSRGVRYQGSGFRYGGGKGMPLTRSQFLKYSAVGAVTFALPLRLTAGAATRRAAQPTLDPASIPKYATQLVVLPAMPPVSKAGAYDYYEISARQFKQQTLPKGYGATTVWGYGAAGAFSAPAFTIEAIVDRPVRVKWTNGLVDSAGGYLPHLFAIDPTLHWANPPGGNAGRDSRPTWGFTPGPYRGPVPLVTHLHGAHSDDFSDGYPEAWYLPAATNVPAGNATVGSYYDQYRSEFVAKYGQEWGPGSAVFQYANDQRAATLWFHDHALGMTRANVYAGLAGLYLLRGGSGDLPAGVLPGPAPAVGDSAGTKYFEIPLVIEDRSFDADGSLYYPRSRTEFDGFTGPYIGSGDSDISPIWNPETFGNTIIVNGRTWPSLKVEARRYRFRILNQSQTRALILKIASMPDAPRPAAAALPFWVIGADGGFLPAPANVSQIVLGGAERADVIVDFTGLKGSTLYLINEGPDEPFGGGKTGVDFQPANPATTGQVLSFVVGPATSADTSTPPGQLKLPSVSLPPASQVTRRLSLNEEDSATLAGVGPRAGLLGIVDANGYPVHEMWMDAATETPAAGSTETWELYNFTEDAHPIHVHLVQFAVVNRQQLVTGRGGMPAQPVKVKGNPIAPEPWERGTKDTVIAYPGQVTRLRATFDRAGRFVWHCHILEHEDNEMMRPYVIA
jgi:bilirubin oxidase